MKTLKEQIALFRMLAEFVSVDETRTTLSHVHVSPDRSELTATSGNALIVVKLDAMARAFLDAAHLGQPGRINCADALMRLKVGESIRILPYEQGCTFPEYSKVIPAKATPATKGKHALMAFDPLLVGPALEAIGKFERAMGNKLVPLEVSWPEDNCSPLRVDSTKGHLFGYTLTAVVMPCRV